ncbi:MAG: FMN-binding protein [Elusimicrobia bacterium]|nr:FMN-binding protein [Elusimicrobiota bacterium]MBD3411560.1 FMN-binding protein [Elusimicrobiota bacterium]
MKLFMRINNLFSRFSVLYGMVFVLGFFYAISQVVVLREFLVIFYGNEIFIGITLGFWLLWIGVGSFMYALAGDRLRDNQRFFIFLQILLPLALLAQIIGIRTVRYVINAPAAEILPLGVSLFFTFLLTMPVGILIGCIFPVSCREYARESGATIASIRSVYILETLGSVAGGLIFSFILAGTVHHVLLVLCLASGLYVNLLIYMHARACESRILRWLVTMFALALCIILIFKPFRMHIIDSIDQMRWKSIQPYLEHVASADSRYQHLAMGKRNNQYSLIGDGKIITSFPETIKHRNDAAAIMAQKPDARNLLVIGGGMDGLIAELLYYPVAMIDYVEHDPTLVSLTLPYLPEKDRSALDDERVSMYYMDARSFVQHRALVDHYDSVIINLPDPVSAHMNRFYTKEFFNALKTIMHPGGIVRTSIVSTENYFAGDIAQYAGSVYRTVYSVFPYVAIAPGTELVFFASDHASVVTDDYEVLADRYEKHCGTLNIFSAEAFRTIFPPERTGFMRRSLHASTAPINTDKKPITYYFTMLVWSHFSGSEWVSMLEHIRKSRAWIFIIPLGVMVLIRLVYAGLFPDTEKHNAVNAYMAVLIMGFCSMAVQIMLILYYQALLGYIYERIGVVTAIFMGGLLCGAYASSKLRAETTCSLNRLVMLLLGSMGIFIFSVKILVNYQINEPGFYGLFLMSGLLTGFMFPIGAALYQKAQAHLGKTAGMVDSADHSGATAGALISGSLMIPLWGIDQSCLVLIALCCFGIIVVIQTIIVGRKHTDARKVSRSWLWKPGWIVVTVCAGLLSAVLVLRLVPDDNKQVTVNQAPDGKHEGSVVKKKKPFPYTLYYRADGTIERIAVNTKYTAPNIQGYNGPIILSVSITPDGIIEDVDIVESYESPEYTQGLDKWINQFVTRDIAESFPFKSDAFDALTQATVTTDAIIEIVNTTVEQINREIFPVLGLTKQIIPKARTDSVVLGQKILPRNQRVLDADRLEQALQSGALSSREALFYTTIQRKDFDE